MRAGLRRLGQDQGVVLSGLEAPRCVQRQRATLERRAGNDLGHDAHAEASDRRVDDHVEMVEPGAARRDPKEVCRA